MKIINKQIGEKLVVLVEQGEMWCRFFAVLTMLAMTCTSINATEIAVSNQHAVGMTNLTLVDKTRVIKASGDFTGSDQRRLDVVLWYPAADASSGSDRDSIDVAADGPWPLIIYAHGTMDYPEIATHFVEHLVKHGYIVAAPIFPLTSSKSFTQVTFPEMSDTPNQTGDVSFVIDQLLADNSFGKAVDSSKIGCAGHSLGAITCYFSSFGEQTRDPRIVADVLIGAGDPVQAALASDFGFDGVRHAHASVPTLLLSGDKDIFAGLGGKPYSAYARIESPKYELMINGGNHIWFRNGDDKPVDGKNPDCLFFEKICPVRRFTAVISVAV